MAKYAKCPRCELNYIDVEKQQYCDICVKEMKGIVDEPFYQEEDEEEMELCPVCGENMMRLGEKMCETCKNKAGAYEREESEASEDDAGDEWRAYLDEEFSEPEDIGVEGDFSMDDEEEEEEEEESFAEEDDMEYVIGDDIYKYDDSDDDDDDDFDFDDDDGNGRGRHRMNDDF